MTEPEVVYGRDDEGEPHALYSVGTGYAFRPTAFCGAVLVDANLMSELPDGEEVHAGCKPTKTEKAEQREVEKAAQPDKNPPA